LEADRQTELTSSIQASFRRSGSFLAGLEFTRKKHPRRQPFRGFLRKKLVWMAGIG
jgi:hypothetical protein